MSRSFDDGWSNNDAAGNASLKRRIADLERDQKDAEYKRQLCQIQSNSRFYQRTGYTPPGC